MYMSTERPRDPCPTADCGAPLGSPTGFQAVDPGMFRLSIAPRGCMPVEGGRGQEGQWRSSHQGAATTIGILKVTHWNDGQSESNSETPGVETLWDVEEARRDPAPPQFCPDTVGIGMKLSMHDTSSGFERIISRDSTLSLWRSRDSPSSTDQWIYSV
ncbi:hypothetical protein BJX96DRAFT_21527 [Aspergillus floccosus]